MQNKKNLTNRKSYVKKISASLFAAIMILSAFASIMAFVAPVAAVDCEIDSDGDGVCDIEDNCPDTYNPDQSDTDGDGVGDVCEPIESNPPLDESCGIDMVLIIDSSGSISPSELQTMKTAFNGFVDAFLPNTPTHIAVVEFDTTAHSVQDYSTDVPTIKGAINSAYSGGWTNWDDALTKAHDLFDNRDDKPDLYVLASDGNPTAHGPTGSYGSTEDHLTPAILKANEIKSDGVRIITLGIGDTLNPANLIAISSADAYYSTDFSTLAATLADLANDLCGGTITVRKYVDDLPAEGWEFTASVTGGYAVPTSGYTDADGFLTFTIEFDQGNSQANVDIYETPQTDVDFIEAYALDCTGASVGTPGYEQITDITIYQDCAIFAHFYNEVQIPPKL